MMKSENSLVRATGNNLEVENNDDTDASNTASVYNLEEIVEKWSNDLLQSEYFKACRGKSKYGMELLTHFTATETVNLRDKNGQTGLNWACATNNFTGVKALLDYRDIDINLPDSEGNTPLMIAAQAGFYTIVQYLVLYYRAQVDIDAENYLGFTALIKAALNGKANCARILIIAGADVTKRDWGKGLRADEWAIRCGMEGTAKIIKNVSMCVITEEQEKELKWSKKRNPISEFCYNTVRYVRRILKLDGDEWITEAGSLYHLAAHCTNLNSRILTSVIKREQSKRTSSIIQLNSISSCIEENESGEDTITIETSYVENKQTIRQRCFVKLKTDELKKSPIRENKPIPDVQLIQASPIKKEKPTKTNIDRKMLIVPTKITKKKKKD